MNQMIIDTILIKASSLCNINCKYCYVYNMGDSGWKNMPALISNDFISALTNQLVEVTKAQNEKFALVLHGGEPLMLGKERLHKLLGSIRSVLSVDYPISIQSNGTLITKDIVTICSRFNTTISISLDGDEEVNDQFRTDKKGNGTYKKVIAGIDCIKSVDEKIFSGLLAVINPYFDPLNVYNHLKHLSPVSIDFLYRDGNFEKIPFGKSSFISTEYGNWLSKLVDIYFSDKAPPKIRIIDDLFKLALGAKPQKEGLGGSDFSIVVIDTNGKIKKNDTLKSSFDGADEFENSWSIFQDKLSDVVNTKIFQSYILNQSKGCYECLNCNIFHICGGGMPLHRWSKAKKYNNPSIYCHDQKTVISKILKKISNSIYI